MASYNSHCFPVELAAHIGLREAILLQYFYHWHTGNRENPAMQIEGRTWFYLSAGKIAEAFPYFSDKQVRTILEHLEEQGMVIKGNHAANQMLRTTWYSLTDQALSLFDLPEWENASAQMGKWSAQMGKCKCYNNNINNISSYEENIKEESIKEEKPIKFDFRKAMLSAGVEPEVADAWLRVRKKRNAVNSEIAWKGILAEIAKTGKTANECIRYAVVQSWRGFKAEWMDRDLNVNPQQPTPSPLPRKKVAEPMDYDFSKDY